MTDKDLNLFDEYAAELLNVYICPLKKKIPSFLPEGERVQCTHLAP